VTETDRTVAPPLAVGRGRDHREQPSAQGHRFAVALVVDDHGREVDHGDDRLGMRWRGSQSHDRKRKGQHHRRDQQAPAEGDSGWHIRLSS